MGSASSPVADCRWTAGGRLACWTAGLDFVCHQTRVRGRLNPVQFKSSGLHLGWTTGTAPRVLISDKTGHQPVTVDKAAADKVTEVGCVVLGQGGRYRLTTRGLAPSRGPVRPKRDGFCQTARRRRLSSSAAKFPS